LTGRSISGCRKNVLFLRLPERPFAPTLRSATE
jgi:hypothetical protein